jgi:crotonobetainyl-CoA:carnitine CoA-transferase CaiB-like acyl-CoA transferase
MLPLDGVKVAAVTVVWAGPHCTQVLAEWGAEVIRVEPIDAIQPYSRGAERIATKEQVIESVKNGLTLFAYPDYDPGQEPWNRNPGFNSHSRNKKSMACNIMTPEGKMAFLKLIKEVDVLVENNVPTTIEKAGITYETLKEINPRLIMLRMPAYGLSGPYKGYRAFGTHVEAMIGHHYIRGYPDGSPDETGEAFTADAFAGLLGATAITAALRYRDATGEGQQIEMPLAEGFLPNLGEFILDFEMNGRVAGPQGNTHHSHAPHGVFPTSGDDQWIAIDVSEDEEWFSLCEVLDADTLASDARFRTQLSRFQNRDLLHDELNKYTIKHQKFDLFIELQQSGVCAGPVTDDVELLESPQLIDRGFFEELESPVIGKHRYPGIMTKWVGTPNSIRTPPPRLGEHSEEIYKQLLGYSDEEYNELLEEGHVGDRYPDHLLPDFLKTSK